MKKSPQQSPFVKTFLKPILKAILGLGLILGTCVCSIFSLFIIAGSIQYVTMVEPPQYPDAERVDGLRGSGSGGVGSINYYCTPDTYSEVIEFMEDYFPKFRYDAENSSFYSDQSNYVADTILSIFEFYDDRSIRVYETIPNDVDNCKSGTYFVISEGHGD